MLDRIKQQQLVVHSGRSGLCNSGDGHTGSFWVWVLFNVLSRHLVGKLIINLIIQNLTITQVSQLAASPPATGENTYFVCFGKVCHCLVHFIAPFYSWEINLSLLSDNDKYIFGIHLMQFLGYLTGRHKPYSVYIYKLLSADRLYHLCGFPGLALCAMTVRDAACCTKLRSPPGYFYH